MAAEPTISKHVIKEIIVIYLKGIFDLSILFYVLYKEMVVCSGMLISLLQVCYVFLVVCTCGRHLNLCVLFSPRAFKIFRIFIYEGLDEV